MKRMMKRMLKMMYYVGVEDVRVVEGCWNSGRMLIVEVGRRM